MVCSDDVTNGEFQSDNLKENKQINALDRISLNVELLQTFLSEEIYKNFQTRKTFQLRTDSIEFKNENTCEVFYTKLNLDTALKMSSNELFLYLANEIKDDKELFNPNFKYIAVLSFTRFIPDSNGPYSNDMFSKTKGFCALGL